MKIISLIILCSTLIVSNLSAQEFGYLGKKNLISIYGTVNPRVVSGILIPLESTDGGHKYIEYDENGLLDRKIKMIRYDFRASYRRMVKRNMAIGVEFGYERYRLTNYSYSQYTTVTDLPSNTSFNFMDDYYIESPQFNVFSYMLVLDLISNSDVPPMGFTSSFGIGPKFYLFNRKKEYRYSSEGVVENAYPEYKNNMMALDIFFDFGYKIPLTRVLAFDIGVRLRTGYLFQRSQFNKAGELANVADNFYGRYQWDKATLHANMRSENLANLVNLKMGFSFIL